MKYYVHAVKTLFTTWHLNRGFVNAPFHLRFWQRSRRECWNLPISISVEIDLIWWDQAAGFRVVRGIWGVIIFKRIIPLIAQKYLFLMEMQLKGEVKFFWMFAQTLVLKGFWKLLFQFQVRLKITYIFWNYSKTFSCGNMSLNFESEDKKKINVSIAMCFPSTKELESSTEKKSPHQGMLEDSWNPRVFSPLLSQGIMVEILLRGFISFLEGRGLCREMQLSWASCGRYLKTSVIHCGDVYVKRLISK